MMVEQGKEVRLALSKSQNLIICQQSYFKQIQIETAEQDVKRHVRRINIPSPQRGK